MKKIILIASVILSCLSFGATPKEKIYLIGVFNQNLE